MPKCLDFLADENIEASIVNNLRSAGHNVLYIVELGGSPTDEKIIELANTGNRILLTNDKGFGDQIFQLRKSLPSVVQVRIKNDDASLKAELIGKVVKRFGDQLAGKFTVVTHNRLRIRGLIISL